MKTKTLPDRINSFAVAADIRPRCTRRGLVTHLDRYVCTAGQSRITGLVLVLVTSP